MDSTRISEDSLTVTELKGGFGGGQKFPVLDAGTYEAVYEKLSVFMDNTQWGEKKAARLYFKITRGKYKDQVTSFKGTFFEDKETNGWVIGSKSKLADAIKAVTGGGNISPANAGTKVFVKVDQKVSKKTGNPYSFVEAVFPAPSDDETLAEATQSVQTPVARPVQAVRPVTGGQVQAPKPVAKPAIPAPVADSGDGLLADLTELSDFKD